MYIVKVDFKNSKSDMVEIMNAALVSLEEYLDSSYSPDREYVDGVVREINVGERAHSKVQSNFVFFLRQRYPHLGVWPELRVRTAPSRIRLPDICVTLEDPGTDVFETPPFICIEILSRRDERSDLLKKLEEYAAMGVQHIWVADPRRRKAFTYRNRELVEVTGGQFETKEPEIVLPLDEVFHDL
jgi:Uma2 family endonuclease